MVGPSATFAVTLERGTDGTYLAWVDDLFGCAVRGRSLDEVLQRLPEEIRRFHEWSGSDPPAVIDIQVRAEVAAAIEADEDTEVLLDADREPLDEDLWPQAEQLLDRSRQQLLATLADLSDEELAASRPGSDRTLREEIEHIAFVEVMYAAWTFDLASRDGLVEFLAWTRAIAADRLSDLAKRRSSRQTSAYWGGAPRPEPWTPRKAARRLLWHELLHLRGIEQ